VVYVHACLSPKWAALGVDGLNEAGAAAWAERPRRYVRLPKNALFRSSDGPLWDRSLVERGRQASSELTRSLRALGVRRMVVGHTQTKGVEGGQEGRILTLHQNRLVLVDVGLGHGADAPRAALIIEGRRGIEWRPSGTRVLWRDRG
jgi:hypothetical protein